MKTSILLFVVFLVLSVQSNGAVVDVNASRIASADGEAGTAISPRDEASSVALGLFDYTATSSASANGVSESGSARQNSAIVFASGELHVSASGSAHTSVSGSNNAFQSVARNTSEGMIGFAVDVATPFTLQVTTALNGSYNGAAVIITLLDFNPETNRTTVRARFQSNMSGSTEGTLLPGHQYTFSFHTHLISQFGPFGTEPRNADSSYSLTFDVIPEPATVSLWAVVLPLALHRHRVWRRTLV